jgi:hypothetical protein
VSTIFECVISFSIHMMLQCLAIRPFNVSYFASFDIPCLIAHISNSSVGAASPILGEAVKRISAVLNSKEEGTAPYDLYEATVRRSFVLSSDQAHALHPNYASKHEKSHQPQMNAGMVIKRNANQRYATTGPTGILMREIARRSNLPPIQEFMVRQDCGCVRIFLMCGVGKKSRFLISTRVKLAFPPQVSFCERTFSFYFLSVNFNDFNFFNLKGSTIGPLISSTTGIRAIDMGCPQLSMHSIRETMGVCDRKLRNRREKKAMSLVCT